MSLHQWSLCQNAVGNGEALKENRDGLREIVQTSKIT